MSHKFETMFNFIASLYFKKIRESLKIEEENTLKKTGRQL